MQQEFSAALYQLMTRTRRKEENDVQSPKLDVMQENGNNAKLNTVVPDNRDQPIVPNGVSKQMIDDKLNVRETLTAKKNINGISIQGK